VEAPGHGFCTVEPTVYSVARILKEEMGTVELSGITIWAAIPWGRERLPDESIAIRLHASPGHLDRSRSIQVYQRHLGIQGISATSGSKAKSCQGPLLFAVQEVTAPLVIHDERAPPFTARSNIPSRRLIVCPYSGWSRMVILAPGMAHSPW